MYLVSRLLPLFVHLLLSNLSSSPGCFILSYLHIFSRTSCHIKYKDIKLERQFVDVFDEFVDTFKAASAKRSEYKKNQMLFSK